MPAICPSTYPAMESLWQGLSIGLGPPLGVTTHLFTCIELYTPKSGLGSTRHLPPKICFAGHRPARQKRMAPWGPLVRQVKLIQFASLFWEMLVRLWKSCIFKKNGSKVTSKRNLILDRYLNKLNNDHGCHCIRASGNEMPYLPIQSDAKTIVIYKIFLHDMFYCI